jgi:hypothetical protein
MDLTAPWARLFAQKIEIAFTYDDETVTVTKEKRDEVWKGVQDAHLKLDALVVESELYGSSKAVLQAQSILDRVQAVADGTDGFDPPKKDMRDSVQALPDQLRAAAAPLAQEARRHLGLR